MKKFDWQHSLLKTYLYYIGLLLVTILLSQIKELRLIWIYGAIRFGYLLYLHFMYVKSIGVLATRVNILSGPPGASKTFITTVLAVRAIATYKMKYKVARLLYEQHGDTVKHRAEWKRNQRVGENKTRQVISLFESYSRMEKEGKLPIISNLTITYKGRKSYDLMPGHLTQVLMIPEGFILVVDEIGQTLGAMGFKDTPQATKDLFRLCRQFWDGYILATEQDHNNIDICVRRVVGENFRLERCKHVGRAYFLEILNRLNLAFQTVHALILEKSYGFRKIAYHIEANTEAQQNIRLLNGEEENCNYFYIPACYCYYDDREKYPEYLPLKRKNLD